MGRFHYDRRSRSMYEDVMVTHRTAEPHIFSAAHRAPRPASGAAIRLLSMLISCPYTAQQPQPIAMQDRTDIVVGIAATGEQTRQLLKIRDRIQIGG